MKIAIAGGDLRMKTVAELFNKSGFECVGIYSKTKADLQNAIRAADAVVLPLPCEKDGFLNAPFIDEKISIDEIIPKETNKKLFVGGMVPKRFENVVDYASREELLIKNAVPTAEGAIALAINELKTTLLGANALVLGYGRIGKYLSRLLGFFGTETTIAARRIESRAEAQISGFKAIGFEEISKVLPEADIVFNTVPFEVLKEKELTALKKGVAVIDLASLPGGVDINVAQEREIKIIRALGLPGKNSPETAGKIIFETVVSILNERGFEV